MLSNETVALIPFENMLGFRGENLSCGFIAEGMAPTFLEKLCSGIGIAPAHGKSHDDLWGILIGKNGSDGKGAPET